MSRNFLLLYRSIRRRRLYYRRKQDILFAMMFSHLFLLSDLIRAIHYRVLHYEGSHMKPLQCSFSNRRLMLQDSGVIPSLIDIVTFISLFSINGYVSHNLAP